MVYLNNTIQIVSLESDWKSLLKFCNHFHIIRRNEGSKWGITTTETEYVKRIIIIFKMKFYSYIKYYEKCKKYI